MKTKDIKKTLMSNDQLLIEEMFENIYNEYYKLIYYIIYSIIKNHENTLDILNDTFIKAFNNIDKFNVHNNESNIKSWIVKIAKNEAINFLKKKKKDKLLSLDLDISNLKDEQISMDKFIIEFKDILDDLELEILIYRIIYNMKLKDIADILKMKINDIYYIYQKALNKLKKYYSLGDIHE